MGSRSAVARASGSSVPRRSFSTSGPENAFCTGTCWSSAKPTSRAIGSEAISSFASSESVKYRRSGTNSIVSLRVRRRAGVTLNPVRPLRQPRRRVPLIRTWYGEPPQMSRPQDKRLPYMPGIDALRAIAVLAVFFYHVNTGGWMSGGFLGVDVFFVISGYLITALLLSEYRQAGHLNVLKFWMRRARRLLPAVAVMIAGTLVLAAIFIPGDVPSLRGDALASLFYVNYWHLVLIIQSYFAQFARPSLFLHLWSLSVEEQFYLLWPLMFAAGMKLFGRQRLLLGALAGAGLSTLLMIILFNPASPDRVFYGTDTRAVGLLLGVALAMVWHPSRLRPIAGSGARWILDGVGVLALVMILRTFLDVHDFDPSLYHGGFLLLAFWTALLVGVLAHPAARLGTVLGTPPLVWLGLRSYSFYLWHWPILMLTRPNIDVPLHGPVLVILH